MIINIALIIWGRILMKTSTFSSIVLSLFMVLTAIPVSVQASNTIDHSSNIFKFQHKLAKNGNVHAQFKLASMYEAGDGVESNIDEAKYWYGIASSAGSHSATQRKTYLNVKEKGFDADRDTDWLNSVKADSKAHKADAVYLMGQMYHEGIGVEKDLNKSLVLFKQIKSLGEANVEREITAINQEMAEAKVAAAKLKKQRAIDNKQARLAKQKEQADQAQLQKTSLAKKTAAEEQLKRAEKRKRYEAVMLNIKLEQQMINQQQAEVHGGEVASMDDEI